MGDAVRLNDGGGGAGDGVLGGGGVDCAEVGEMKRRDFLTLLAGLPVVGKYLRPKPRSIWLGDGHLHPPPSSEYTMTVSNTDSVLWINSDGHLMVTDGREWDNLSKPCPLGDIHLYSDDTEPPMCECGAVEE